MKRLEAGAEWLSGTVRRVMGREEPDTPGAGAAGGLGFGALSFFGARVKNGVNTVLDMYEFEKHLEDADVVITDEGKLDFQSIMGKAAGGVIARTKSKTCIVLCGSNEAESLPKGVSAVSISEGAALATP